MGPGSRLLREGRRVGYVKIDHPPQLCTIVFVTRSFSGYDPDESEFKSGSGARTRTVNLAVNSKLVSVRIRPMPSGFVRY